MMEILKHLLFNLSLILLFMFIFRLAAERYYPEPLPPVFCFLGLFLSLIVCLWFSIPIDGVMMDLRQIPIIIGGLYYGLGPLLAILSLILRGLLYGFNSQLLAVTPIYLLLALALWLAHPWFLKQKSRKRIRVSIYIVAATSALIFGALLIRDITTSELEIALVTTFIQCIGIGMMSYLLEEMIENEFFRNQMMKSQKIELASHMSAAISHEVRNPLTAALGFLQLATEDISIQGKTKWYIVTAINELQEAERVIKDYFTFAQPSFNEVNPFCVNEELKKVIKSLYPLANMNSVEVLTEINTECFILGDRGHFRQCLLNIMKNSIEAMPNGGKLTVHSSSTKKEIRIRISDSGIGMSAEQVQRLGEPYYSIKGKKGTGLGLMVSLSIIRALKGNFHIDSQIGVGTEFVIAFPAYFSDNLSPNSINEGASC